MAISLIDKTVLVTGAAKRLGQSVALALANAGADVVLHYHHSKVEALDVADMIRERGRRAWCVQADLADPEEAQGLVERVCHETGTLDGLVNNASIFPADTLLETSWDAQNACDAVNAWAPLALARALYARECPCAVVNMLDCRMVDYDREHAAYHLSKRRLFSLTRMLAVECAPRMRVNAVAPGLVLPPPGMDNAYVEKRKTTNPLQSKGTPQEVAEAVVFLLTAPFVTGQILFLDGGRHLRGSMYGA